ncbi:MAG: T9SS type A sorting domain-containing protein [Flavobacteriales bacterium]|nr:T9SS type A sorting domain-containing protein [Flavobacteriales bacterium]
MKNRVLLSLALILLMFSSLSSIRAQESELGIRQQYERNQALIVSEETKIDRYINQNINIALPQVVMHNFAIGIEKHEHAATFTELAKQEMYTQLRRQYWRVNYFQKNPKARQHYKAIAVGSCTNGGFEDTLGFITYTGESAIGSANGYQLGDCGILTANSAYQTNPIIFSPNNPNTAIAEDFSIMDVGPDLLVTTGTLQKVWAGNHSARINSNLNDPNDLNSLGNPWHPNYSVSKLIKRVVLSGVDEEIYFNYALVMVDPNNHDGEKPTLVARILDATGNECDRICHAAYSSDTLLLPAVPGGSIRYKPWNCQSLQACGQPGDTVTLEFIQTDCGKGGHWGYAYIDDICDTCSGPTDTCNYQGDIQLLPTDTCSGDSMQVCGTYELATVNCTNFSASEIRLYIQQNGAIVAGPLTNTNPSGETFCFTVTPGDLPAGSMPGDGFDFYVEIDFVIGSSTTIANDYHSNSGLNNDYILDAQCCPEFTLLTCCDLTGVGTANRAASVIDARVQKSMDDYKKAVAAQNSNFDAAADGCCDYCEYPNVAFPVFIYDETGTMLIDNSVYTISWSNDPTNNSAIGMVLPDQSVVVTVSGPDSCVWTKIFLFECCQDPGLPGICCDPIDFEVNLDSLCDFDPCQLPNVQFPIQVSSDGSIIGIPAYSFQWSNGTFGSTASASQSQLPITVTVTDNSTGCTTVGSYDIDCNPPPCIIKTPDSLDCYITHGGQWLSWNSIANAVDYEIEFYYNDPSCCPAGGAGSITIPISTGGSANYFVSNLTDCFSWRVRSVCADGTRSAWSKKSCSCVVPACIIKAPINLNCQITHGGQNLTSAAVFNAVSYEIEIYKNDPSCCLAGGAGSITIPIPVNGTSYFVSNLTDCFSWRVRSVCADGTRSAWSKRKCSCGISVSCFIKAPENLDCTLNRSSQLLTWSSVSNAVSYEIEFYYNDPACCGTGNPGSITIPIPVNGTSYVVSTTTSCFSWRVRSICSDGTRSAWSKSLCSCGLRPVIIGGPQKISKDGSSSINDINDLNLHHSAVPNPAKNNVTISFHDHDNVMEVSNANIVITEVTGREVYNSSISINEAKQIDVSEFSSGVYVYRILYKGKTLVTDKLIIE